MRFSELRIGAPLSIVSLTLSAAAALAAPSGPALVTPALLSMNSMTAESTPQLRVVAGVFSHEDLFVERRVRAEIVMPAAMRAASDRAFVQRGVEAIARYSSSHMDDNPTPWQEGFQPHERDTRLTTIATTTVPGTTTEGAPPPGASTLGAHAGIAWSAPTQVSSAQSIQNIGETTNISIVRTLVHVANPILEMADGLRALHMNQLRVGDGLTLKLDGRTGRHARCFAILTQRF
jgi:hypothetical protein